MVSEGLNACLFVISHLLFAVEIRAAAKCQVNPDARRLIDHDQPLRIRKPHDLFAVRIMAAAEAVGSLPFHQRDILHIHGYVLASSVRERVLVFPIPFKVKRLLIDQKSVPVNPYGADPVRQLIGVLPTGHFYSVQIRIQRLPEMCILNENLPAESRPCTSRNSVRVKHLHSAGLLVADVLSAHPDLIAKRDVSAPFPSMNYFRNQSNIINITLRHDQEPHRPCDPTVIKEVKVRIICLFLRLVLSPRSPHVFQISDGKRVIIDPVIHCHCQKIVVAQFLPYLDLKREESTEMISDLFSVQKHPRKMRDGLKAQYHSLITVKRRRAGKLPLIKNITVMVAEGHILLQVIVG